MIQGGKRRSFAISTAIEVRTDYTSGELRWLAQRTKNSPQARRLLAIAAVLDGASREEATKIGGMDCKIARSYWTRFHGLKRHSRFRLHFTPTSGSWLNMVERFFAEITRKRIRRGVFKSVDELKQAIMNYLNNHNGNPKPYVWTKTAAEIFSKVARAKQALESQH
jgi:hypothetical protein